MVPESYRWEFIKQESAGVKQLAAETGYPEVFAGLLAARGVHNDEGNGGSSLPDQPGHGCP